MREYLARLATKTTVAACSGNHDLDARNDLDERSAVWLQGAQADGVYVDGTSISTPDVLISVFPWWDGPRTRARVDELFASEATRVGDRRWIWVYHAPPDQSPTSWTGRRYYGDSDLNAWIDRYQPALVLCGHVHESPFVDEGAWSHLIGTTWVVNAGRQSGPLPPHVVIDTEQATAEWWSVVGRGELSFAATQYSG
jgi:Icc-related predicted phosphoesterase